MLSVHGIDSNMPHALSRIIDFKQIENNVYRSEDRPDSWLPELNVVGDITRGPLAVDKVAFGGVHMTEVAMALEVWIETVGWKF